MKNKAKLSLRLTSLALVFGLLFALSVSVFAEGQDQVRLSFNDDGNFKILQIADCQDNNRPNSKMIGYIKAALRQLEPDLVVFTGDNIKGDRCNGLAETQEAIKAIVQPVVDSGTPFTIVFGNHDNEGGISNAVQLEYYQSFPLCLAYSEPNLIGEANHNIPIFSSSNSSKMAYNLWFFDSGNPKDDTYFTDASDDIRLSWYSSRSDELKAQNNGEPVPSMAFQHIIFPGVYSHFFKDSNPIPRVRIDEYLVLDDNCPASVTKGQFDAFLDEGNIKAAVFGHYHMTNSVSTLKGIDIIQTPGASFSAYGHEDVRGLRLITLDENDTENYQTYIWLFKDHEADSTTEGLSFFQKIMQMLRDFWDKIKTLFKFGK